ncbi:GyrI-like domain-containing protein [Actinomadura macrotermitis]|uniref:GyrI-like small molecule binding domain-containing protein n=1 Tax=Actinomadura macrotermitis TaxID=2585200 RepID=A0A7K0BWH3_9ACTN|nr:GyrI-like domain-containing protein [Actinomadura macrotermitis]MQY05518.1 hypothetical protein [Actinomadura macrotermitis]
MSDWYKAAEEPEIVEFGPVRGLAVSGQGAPGGPAYTAAVGALYGAFGPLGLVPPPLEGRWWVNDERPPLEVPREEWHWQLFLRVPDGLDPDVSGHDGIEVVEFGDGLCVQMLHCGPYSEEPRSLARMGALMDAEGLVHAGLHHELYLTDPREPDGSKVRVILRQPVRPA